jgi:pimeloyl-ACP methyl ester carboxylesterase
MPKIALRSDWQFEYEQHGPADGEPLLAIMGLGAQLTAWVPPLVAAWAARGFRVTLFDNRDSGLSHRCTDAGGPVGTCGLLRVGCYLFCCCRGCGCDACGPPPVPYTLNDMAEDASLLVRDVHFISMYFLWVLRCISNLFLE